MPLPQTIEILPGEVLPIAIANCQLNYCLLLIAYCHLPLAYCQLKYCQLIFCLLPIAYCQ
ncbi:MAG: hypothetical protein EBR30_15405 [Cytophagia bacterium]|nr:hypothetical protein [Cytophagia bacterium]